MKTTTEAINAIIGVLRGRDTQHRAQMSRELRKLSPEFLEDLCRALGIDDD